MDKMPNASEGMVNKECVPSGPAKDGNISGQPARATGNIETTCGKAAQDAEKGGTTNTLDTCRVSGESASEHRARVVSVGDVDGDSSADPLLYTEILLLSSKRKIYISRDIVMNAVGEKGSLDVDEEILITFKTGTEEEVDKIVRHRHESSGQG